jgi:hypothetical protein
MAKSKLQKLGFRYLEHGETVPEFAQVIRSWKGKTLYKRYKPKYILANEKASSGHAAIAADIKKQLNWSSKNYEQITKLVNNLFENNVDNYPIVNNLITLPQENSYVFFNQVSPEGLDNAITNYPDSTFVFFGDVLSDKAVFSKIMKLKATIPQKVILSAFSGPYEKLSFVFNKLPFEAKVGKFVISPIFSNRENRCF